tara:strand:+ start:90 stop:383 length:294 start_codon:yes stop_codon:yes gene_type:complete
MNIQNIQSAPSYISDFINTNFTKLIEIYDNGLKEEGIGILCFSCSQETNKMDVFFLNEDNICKELSTESWENLKKSTEKKIFLVKDLDHNSIFLIYI